MQRRNNGRIGDKVGRKESYTEVLRILDQALKDSEERDRMQGRKEG